MSLAKRRVAALGLGFLMFAITLFLFWPLGCFDADRGPGTYVRRPGECPNNLTHVGMEWPNGIAGIFGASLLAIIIGIAVGIFAWKKLVPPSTRRADSLKL